MATTSKKETATIRRKLFRNSVRWQLFRKLMLAKANNTCEFCGQHYSRESSLNIHHKFVTNYENLEPSRFMVVCWTCHKFIHAKGSSPVFKDRRLVGLKD